MTLDKLLLPRYLSFFALQVIWGFLVSAIAYLLSLLSLLLLLSLSLSYLCYLFAIAYLLPIAIFESWQLSSEFSTDLQDSGL